MKAVRIGEKKRQEQRREEQQKKKGKKKKRRSPYRCDGDCCWMQAKQKDVIPSTSRHDSKLIF
jgi:hypothetical protein